jgi:hypothetical protein
MENQVSRPRIIKIVAGLPAQALILAVLAYQLLISPWLGSVCRYHPTCSRYMIAAVRKHGFWRGGWLGLRRIGRCHPWHPGGYDPP